MKSAMKSSKLIIATRKSSLAMWQAQFIQQQLQMLHPALKIELLSMTTQGDRFLAGTLQKIGGKGLFVKELEQALIERRADIAVHSLKDVPYQLPDGLSLSVICKSENPFDVFVSKQAKSLTELPFNARIGTSSLRRQCQLLLIRPDLQIIALRGNVQTRLNKLDENQFDAIILAAAGLTRLNLGHRIQSYFSLQEMLPAVGQGVLAIESRTNDPRVIELISPLEDSLTRHRITAERAFNQRLEGGCHTPTGAFAEVNNHSILLHGFVGHPEKALGLRASLVGSCQNAEQLGIDLANLIRKRF